MSHVSEGILHAYLDGALDELSGGEADAIRDHIAGCGECAAQLGEARAVREEAISILGGTLPAIEMPPLEDLRARAAVMPVAPRDTSRRLNRLGWAASVVLAVGAGWLLRGGQAVPVGMVDPVELQTSVAAQPAAVDLVATSEVDAADGRLFGDAAGAPSPSDVVASRTEQVASGSEPTVPSTLSADAVAESEPRRMSVVASAGAIERSEETMTDVPPRTGLREITAESPAVIRGSVAGSAPLRQDRAESIPPAQSAELRASPEARDLVAIAPERERESVGQALNLERTAREPTATSAFKATAELSLVSSSHSDEDEPSEHLGEAPAMVISGLEVIDMAWFVEGVVAGGVRVLQELEDGEMLELLHLPEGVDPDDLEPFPQDGKTGVITPRDGGWLILRANRTVEELQALLQRLDGVS